MPKRVEIASQSQAMRVMISDLLSLYRVLLMVPVVGVLVVGSPCSAWASGWQVQREPLPAREVERSPVLPRGWWQLSGIWEYQITKSTRGPDSRALSSPVRRQKMGLVVRYGVLPGLEVWAELPVTVVSLGRIENNRTRIGWGSTPIGLRVLFAGRQVPMTALVAEMAWWLPSSTRSGTVGTPDTLVDPIPGAGVSALDTGLRARHEVGPVALDGRVHYTHWFPAEVPYEVTVEGEVTGGRFIPGARVGGMVEALLQMGPLVVATGGALHSRFETVFDSANTRIAVPRSSGLEVEWMARAMIQFSRGVQLEGSVSIPLYGEAEPLVPLEELIPTAGSTGSLALRLHL